MKVMYVRVITGDRMRGWEREERERVVRREEEEYIRKMLIL